MRRVNLFAFIAQTHNIPVSGGWGIKVCEVADKFRFPCTGLLNHSASLFPAGVNSIYSFMWESVKRGQSHQEMKHVPCPW